MLKKLLQPSKLFVANIADPNTRKIFKRITNIMKSNALVATMQQNFFEVQMIQLTLVALKSTGWSVLRDVCQHWPSVDENYITEFALEDFCDVDWLQ